MPDCVQYRLDAGVATLTLNRPDKLNAIGYELADSTRDLAQRIMRHSPLAVSGVINSVTRGLNVSIGEGLSIESEQFARMAPTSRLLKNSLLMRDRDVPPQIRHGKCLI